MIKPMTFDGVSYTPDIIREVRERVIAIRDEALKNNCFGDAVTLSHTIGLLYHMAQNTEAE